MNHLACNTAQTMHNVIWAHVKFFPFFLCFIVLANCSALLYYSDDVMMITKQVLYAHPHTSNNKQQTTDNKQQGDGWGTMALMDEGRCYVGRYLPSMYPYPRTPTMSC